MTQYEGQYPRDPIRILKAACDAVSVPLSCVLPVNECVGINTIDLVDWVTACRRLYLNPNCIFEGYCPEEHKRMIKARAGHNKSTSTFIH